MCNGWCKMLHAKYKMQWTVYNVQWYAIYGIGGCIDYVCTQDPGLDGETPAEIP